jgi:1-acyl-sn-glycerol-3-phosphate acyltransferase
MKFYRFAYVIVIPCLRLLFRVRVKGREHVPKSGAMVLCANHTSLKDPVFVAIVTGIRRPLCFLAKDDLFDVPVLRTIIKWLGAFPVARGQADIAAVRQSVDLLKNGARLLIFPDGRRVHGRGEAPPQLGAAMIASRAGVPILPVYMSFPKRWFRRTDIIIKPPIYPEDRKGGEYYRELTVKIEEAMWTGE